MSQEQDLSAEIKSLNETVVFGLCIIGAASLIILSTVMFSLGRAKGLHEGYLRGQASRLVVSE